MKSLDVAQDEIMNMATNIDEIGSAVLLGGCVLRTSETKWSVVMANVGNCKAFSWSPVTGNAKDLTPNNTSRDRADSSGKLGNADANGKPDTRNLSLYYAEVDDGDFVILLSPGAYHNFDPELLGLTPYDINLSTGPYLPPLAFSFLGHLDSGLALDSNAEWTTVKDSEPAKDKFRCEKMEDLLEKVLKTDPAEMARKITSLIGIYCMDLTKPTRTLMESNRSAREPSDHVKYPGMPFISQQATSLHLLSFFLSFFLSFSLSFFLTIL